MKITLYELLGLIKDGKAPKRILFGCSELLWLESEEEYIGDGFEHLNLSMIVDNLNDEVEILDEPKEHKKIIKIKEENGWCGKQSTGNEIILKMKVNELIDEVNKLKEVKNNENN